MSPRPFPLLSRRDALRLGLAAPWALSLSGFGRWRDAMAEQT
jgi:hypothetical protein